MEKFDIYKDIAKRTNGDIYVGVVGPVRTGKSTFITKFMELLVLPNISNKNKRMIATDEMPQSAEGKTIMTTEPKFVPSEAVKIQIKDKITANVRLIDCVGYLVDGAIGHEENDKPRYVKTPWSNEAMPFNEAAELGTKKVINDHSTIGIVMTTDGSITDLKRESYIAAEERVIGELKIINKPFVIALNCKEPTSSASLKLKSSLEEKYSVPVININATTIVADEMYAILEKILLEFPIESIEINLPLWMQALPKNSKIIGKIIARIKDATILSTKMKDYAMLTNISDSEEIEIPEIKEVTLGDGVITYDILAKSGLFYKVLSEECGESIDDEYHLINYVKSLSVAKIKYSKIKQALLDAEETGYGIVIPDINEMLLNEPEMVKSGGRYGVKLKATAPSLHIMKVDVSAEVSPIVGTEQQSEDLVKYLLSEFENDPKGIWETNMFGKSLHSLVREGLSAKIEMMPKDTQNKLRKTVYRIVNEGKGGVICILL